MATDANTLLDETRCYECLSPGEWQLIKLGLLKQILLATNPMADTSPNALLEAAKCYECYGMPGIWQLLELGLLQQIVAGGGTGGGGGGVTCGTGAPVAAPASGCGLYIDDSTGTLYEYYSGAWH